MSTIICKICNKAVATSPTPYCICVSCRKSLTSHKENECMLCIKKKMK